MTTPSAERLVSVAFDAATNSFSVTPNPVAVGPGSHRLYLALHTVNRGDAPEAKFLAIYEDNLIARAEKVGACDQLWQVEVSNQPPVTQETVYNYTLRVQYAGSEHAKDPSVVLQPPPTEPPAAKS